jgi:hypothetical protein
MIDFSKTPKRYKYGFGKLNNIEKIFQDQLKRILMLILHTTIH